MPPQHNLQHQYQGRYTTAVLPPISETDNESPVDQTSAYPTSEPPRAPLDTMESASQKDDPVPPYEDEVSPPLLKVRSLNSSILFYMKMGFDLATRYTSEDNDNRRANMRYFSPGYSDVKIVLEERSLEQYSALLPDTIKLGLVVPSIRHYKFLVEQLGADVFGERFFSEHEFCFISRMLIII